MAKVIRTGVYYLEGRLVKEAQAFMTSDKKEKAVKNTISYGILRAHCRTHGEGLSLRFDALVSHGGAYVGVVQTAKAGGMEKFPAPFTLAAAGGAENGVCAFGLSAAKKYGGDFVPSRLAGIRQYAREKIAKSGQTVLGPDPYTRFGALGCFGMGEEAELVKQLLGQTCEISRPQIVAVYLKGKLRKGVGPQDVALDLIRAVRKNNFAKGKILEFFGPGLKNLSMDLRNGIDTATGATGCLSTVWETDGATEAYFREHGREKDFKRLAPAGPAYYDGGIVVDLSRAEPMIALPVPSLGIYPVRELLARPSEILREAEERGKKVSPDFTLRVKEKDGKIYVGRAVVADGSYEDIAEAAEILRGGAVRPGLSFCLRPASLPVWKSLAENGYAAALAGAGAAVGTVCGPCLGGEDAEGPCVCHAAPDLAEREGNLSAAVVLMDARSIAATVKSGGELTSALGLEYNRRLKKYRYDGKIYEGSVYRGTGRPEPETELVCGPDIADLPEQTVLADELLIKVVSRLNDPVTAADDLIPPGKRACPSDPEKLASFTLSRKDPGYAARAKEVRAWEEERRRTGKLPEAVLKELRGFVPAEGSALGSAVVAAKAGGGPASGRAALCQRVLGGAAYICGEYTDGRYRADLIGWGMLPLVCDKTDFAVGDYLYIEGVADAVSRGEERIVARVISGGKVRSVVFRLGELGARERAVLLAGSFINYSREN